MFDPFMRTLGLEGEIPTPGRATVRGTLGLGHTNSLGSAHGGFLYTIADAAFALASNSHGATAVALSTHMEYLAPTRVGDVIEAVATEVHLGRRAAVYQVELRVGDTLVALFTGTVHRLPDRRTPLIPDAMLPPEPPAAP
jgi:acyl-CoA thioesterase